MIAYDLPNVRMQDAPEWIRTSRLAGAAAACTVTGGKPSRWSFCLRMAGGCTASLDGFRMADARPPILTSEGWWCYLPKVLPEISTRGRIDMPEVVPVLLRCGVTLGIPNAAVAPRAIVFTAEGGGYAGNVEQWSRDAWELYLSRELYTKEDGQPGIRMMASDQEIIRTVAGALLRAYALTHEWLSEYGLVTSADFMAFLLALWGLDPKAAPGADGV